MLFKGQLDALNQYLKGASFTGTNLKNQQDPRKQLKGAAVTTTGPFKGNDEPTQCYKCWGWGHRARQCGSKTWIPNPNEDKKQGNACGEGA